MAAFLNVYSSNNKTDVENAEGSGSHGSFQSSRSPDPLNFQPRSPSYGRDPAEFQRSPICSRSKSSRETRSNFFWKPNINRLERSVDCIALRTRSRIKSVSSQKISESEEETKEVPEDFKTNVDEEKSRSVRNMENGKKQRSNSNRKPNIDRLDPSVDSIALRTRSRIKSVSSQKISESEEETKEVSEDFKTNVDEEKSRSVRNMENGKKQRSNSNRKPNIDRLVPSVGSIALRTRSRVKRVSSLTQDSSVAEEETRKVNDGNKNNVNAEKLKSEFPEETPDSFF